MGILGGGAVTDGYQDDIFIKELLAFRVEQAIVKHAFNGAWKNTLHSLFAFLDKLQIDAMEGILNT